MLAALVFATAARILAADDDPPDEEPDPLPICGDGVLEDGEDCDDGNTHGRDGCDPDCHIEPILACGGALPESEELACDEDNEDCIPTCPITAY